MNRLSTCLAPLGLTTKGLPLQLRAGLAGADWNEPASVTALFMAAQKHFPSSVPSNTDDDYDTDYDATVAYELHDST